MLNAIACFILLTGLLTNWEQFSSRRYINETYFKNYPEEKEVDGILYGIVLVNQLTWERETKKSVSQKEEHSKTQ